MSKKFSPALVYTAISAVVLFSTVSVRGQTPVLDSEQQAFLTLINNYRLQNGAGPLQVSIALENSSQWMSTDMAAKNYFSHTDSLGRDPFTRMAAFGYSYYPEGENIAAGNSTAQSTLVQWQTACDPDASGACTYAHRQNMLNASYKVIGIGRAYGAGSTYGWYWTTDFGAVVDQTLGSTGSAPQISSFTANPSTLNAGQSSTLSWNVSGATSLSLNNGIGDVSTLTSRIVTPAMTTTYQLSATNSSGTTTASVTITVFSAVDTQPPSAPGNLAAVAKNSTEVDLSWTASSDNVGVTGYQIIRNGLPLTTVGGGTLSFGDTSVSANGGYTYYVKAFDAAGNYSITSNPAQVTTPPSSTASPQSIAVYGGSPQTANVGAAFGALLQGKVVDASGNPVASVMVTFNAPVTGASATFPGGAASALAFTNNLGIATAPALTANSTAGSYSVTASTAGLAAASFSLSNTSTAPGPGSSGAGSIWTTSTTPAIGSLYDGNAVELGVKFRSDSAGSISGIRFYKGVLNTGSHTGSLWSSNGALLASGTFTGESATGWQTLTFTSPVAIAANTTYVASYHSVTGIYSVDFGYFFNGGADNGTLHALKYGSDGPDGVLAYGPGGQFPSGDGHGNNYWVDVLFSTSAGSPPPPAPTPQSITVTAGSGQSAAIGSAFATPLQAKVLDASGNPVAGVPVTFSVPATGASATFAGGVSSASAVTNGQGVAASATLTANNTAGAYSAIASVTGLTPVTFSLTNIPVAAPPPPPGSGTSSIWSDAMTPAIRSLSDGRAVELGVKFRSGVAGSITGVRFYKGPLNTGVHTGSLWSSTGTLLATGTFTNETTGGWQTLTFSNPVPIAANTTYVASYYAANGIYAVDFSYFVSHGADNGVLHALQYGVDGPNGVFLYGPGGQFPASGSYGNNYWVDVLFVSQ